MNKEGSVVQVAILVMIIAVLGIALLSKWNLLKNTDDVSELDADAEQMLDESENQVLTTTGTSQWTDDKVIVERWKTQSIDLVKAYFAALGQKSYASACSYLSPTQCTPTNVNSVASFSTEYKKLRKGYEFLSIKDFGIVSESGREVVCVKYAYTYKEDTNPQQVREILSFYIEPSPVVPDRLQIAARVCEKKYKDGLGERPCPVQALQPYCTELMKG